MSLRWEDDTGSYDLAPQQRNAAVIGNPPHGDSYWSGGSHQESYVLTSPGPNAGYWPSTAVSSHFPPPFAHDQSPDEVYCGSSSGVPANTSGNSLFMGMETAPSVSDNAIPEMEPSMFQSYPPFQVWMPVPGGQWDTTPSWDHPVQPSGQFNDSSVPVASLAMQSAAPPFQMTVSSMTSGPSNFAVIPTSGLPMMAPSNSVLPLSSSDPVAVTPHWHSRSPGEQSDSLGTTTFQCLWRNRARGTRCTALIMGDRKSVSSHLREAHDFLCDVQMIECAWDECALRMQRRNIPRHIVSRHFEIKVECPQCGLPFSRADAKKKHRQACTGVRMPAVMGASEEDEGGNF